MSLEEKCYKNKKMFTCYKKVDNVLFDSSKFILLLCKFSNLFILKFDCLQSSSNEIYSCNLLTLMILCLDMV